MAQEKIIYILGLKLKVVVDLMRFVLPIDFLDRLATKVKTYESAPTTLNLFSDSSSGQNKNQFTMVTLLHYINFKATIFKKSIIFSLHEAIVICHQIEFSSNRTHFEEKREYCIP